MKRILMFGWELPPFNSGGLGVACYGLARALVRSGAEIVFVLPRQIDVDPKFMNVRFAESMPYDLSQVSLRTIDTLLTPYITDADYQKTRHLSGKRAPYRATLYEEVMAYAEQARVIAREENCDLIYTHDWLSFPAGIAAKEETGKPLVAHVHATEIDRGAVDVSGEVAQVEKQGLEMADHVIAVSEYTKNIIVEQYGIDHAKVDVVYNGIEKEDFSGGPRAQKLLTVAKKRGTKIVLFVGRLTSHKGFIYFLDAAAKALQKNPNLLFVAAGSGDLDAQMMHRTAELGISDKVLFMGFVRGADLQAAYGAADLFVMPSVSEPFGITTLEAMLHETPVIVSRQSGVAEVAKHTLKVDFWDTEDLAAKMLAVVSHDILGQHMIQSAKKEVRGLSWDRAAQRCLWIFHNKFGQK